MIRKSFILFTGIGRAVEKRLWNSGAIDWTSLPPHLPSRLSDVVEKEVEIAEEKLLERNVDYFYDALPSGERWRLMGAFSEDVAYLDIELDGWDRYSRPTVVGIYKSGKFTSLVRGISLSTEAMAEALDGVDVLVTYNGRRHDMHFLRNLLPDKFQNSRVIDLRHMARQAGFTGGLKSLERQIGVVRDRYVELAGTGQAVRLWKLWRTRGLKGPLELLRAYNREDTCNLLPIGLRLGSILEERTVKDVV